jgi:RNA polymerase sigma-70 factor (ECF subfamily)
LSASDHESHLIRQCRLGNRASWRTLLLRYTPLVYRVAYRVLRDSAEAQDVTQEVFIRVHRSLSSFDESRPLVPWLSRIAYHVALRRHQSKSTSRLVNGDPEILTPLGLDLTSTSDPEQMVAQAETYGLLAKAFEKLCAQDRVLLELRYREGLTDTDLSDVTGMPVNTVKTRLFRARAVLRKSLQTVRGGLS